jgi:putative ABC transport system ATP-binding protein
MGESLVSVQKVWKTYRRGSEDLHVLKGFDLEVEKGEFVALMGPSGCGKSTLLHLMGALDEPDTGRVLFAGEDLDELSSAERAGWRARNVGFVFQSYNLVPVLTAFQNVMLPLLLTPLSRKQRKEQARLALEIVSMGDRMSHYPNQLSGGQEQRVSIARAIATDPTLLLADEPTGDLDAANAEAVLEILRRLNQDNGLTIVMVTHDPHAAQRAHRTVHLEKETADEVRA